MVSLVILYYFRFRVKIQKQLMMTLLFLVFATVLLFCYVNEIHPNIVRLLCHTDHPGAILMILR